MHTGFGFSQVPAEMLCKGFYSRFRCIVCRISWRIGDALFAARDNNGGGPTFGSLLNYREEGVDAMDDAKEVRLEDLWNVRGTRHCQWWKY